MCGEEAYLAVHTRNEHSVPCAGCHELFGRGRILRVYCRGDHLLGLEQSDGSEPHVARHQDSRELVAKAVPAPTHWQIGKGH